jgi:uncharacterized integral membrane protein
MGRIIFSIISLIVLAVIIVMNAGTSVPFNLFGWIFDDVPIIVVAILSFVLGALHSFIFYATSYLARQRKVKLQTRKNALDTQEKSIKSQEATRREVQHQAESVGSSLTHPGASSERVGGKPRGRLGKKPKAGE